MTLSNSAKIEYIYHALVEANDILELWRQITDPELELAIKYADDLRKLDLINVIDSGDD
jgi:hypothetical protein